MEAGGLYIWEILQKFCGSCSFLRVRFNSLPNSYLKKNYIFELGRGITTLLWHHLQGCSGIIFMGELGLKIKMRSLEECHWSDYQVVVFSLWFSVRLITFPCFWNSELNYNILEDVWGVKGTLKCLKIQKRSQRMLFAPSTS